MRWLLIAALIMEAGYVEAVPDHPARKDARALCASHGAGLASFAGAQQPTRNNGTWLRLDIRCDNGAAIAVRKLL